jgi:phosphoribosyl 1,2-cyclic phosphate phosphodiesterase
VLVLDALRFTDHPTHLTIAESTAIAREVRAGRTYFIHLTHDIDHDLHSRDLPENISFAYDELVVEI